MKLISSPSTRSGTVRPRLGRLLAAVAVLTGVVVFVLPAQTAAAASPASRDCVDTNGPWIPGPCGDRPGDQARRQAEDTRERVQQQAQDTRERDQEQAQATRERVQQQAQDTRERDQEQAQATRERARRQAEAARRHSHGPGNW